MSFDYSKARNEVASRLGIPNWFTGWSLRFERCGNGDLVETVHPDWTWIRERLLRGRRGDRCYQVKVYEVFEYVTKTWVGDWCAYIELDPSVERELRQIIQSFLSGLNGEIRDFLDPGAGDAVDWFRKFGSIAAPLLDVLDIGMVGDLVKLQDILDKMTPLAEKIRNLRDALDRIAPYRIQRRAVGRWRVTKEDDVWNSGEWRLLHQSVSSIEEIECNREISGLPDGQMQEAGVEELYFEVPLPQELRDRITAKPLSLFDLEQYLNRRRRR